MKKPQFQFNLYKLTSAIVHGEEESFNLFYEKYFRRLYQYGLVICQGDEVLTQDILQEAMLKIIRYMKPFQEEEIFLNWLFRIIRTTFIDEIRRQKKSPVCLLPEIPELDQWIQKENSDPLLSILEEIFQTLPATEQKLITERYEERKSHQQIAEKRNSTAKAIESQLGRIRKKIRTLILEKL